MSEYAVLQALAESSPSVDPTAALTALGVIGLLVLIPLILTLYFLVKGDMQRAVIAGMTTLTMVSLTLGLIVLVLVLIISLLTRNMSTIKNVGVGFAIGLVIYAILAAIAGVTIAFF
ncbi:MAG: hypothetical protein IJT54_10055 [Candidatus Methanomethylophilaceae archaeon]|nr:hypothetical protein [Candidatus Methanomethylophilaceae archaeon]